MPEEQVVNGASPKHLSGWCGGADGSSAHVPGVAWPNRGLSCDSSRRESMDSHGVLFRCPARLCSGRIDNRHCDAYVAPEQPVESSVRKHRWIIPWLLAWWFWQGLINLAYPSEGYSFLLFLINIGLVVPLLWLYVRDIDHVRSFALAYLVTAVVGGALALNAALGTILEHSTSRSPS